MQVQIPGYGSDSDLESEIGDTHVITLHKKAQKKTIKLCILAPLNQLKPPTQRPQPYIR